MNLRIDLQTHTNCSPECGWMTPETLVQRAERVGLDGVAVTDHNTVEAVERARRAASDDLLVIPAEEIDTPEGQIIGLFLSERVEPWQSPATILDEIHDQGGLALAPHPFDEMRDGLTTIETYTGELDAVETLNARCVRDQYNRRAEAFAEEYELPATGGSDAHFAREIGTAYTNVQVLSGDDRGGTGGDTQSDGTNVTETGSDSENRDRNESETSLSDVKQAIRAGRTEPQGGTNGLLVHAATKSVKLYRELRRGIVRNP